MSKELRVLVGEGKKKSHLFGVRSVHENSTDLDDQKSQLYQLWNLRQTSVYLFMFQGQSEMQKRFKI